ncbi:hypothetical protein [Streptomyces sp. NPDC096339]|uniref:hypothetical protein n=1 Tax=Streptomyces sp. NPDC096339 TaxID=3366086 RepID=UPI00382EC9D1
MNTAFDLTDLSEGSSETAEAYEAAGEFERPVVQVRASFLGVPVGSVEIDYKRQGGVTTVPLYSAESVALLPVVRPSVDWRAVYAASAGARSPLAALGPVVPGRDWVLLAEVARVGRAAVVNWRRRHADFPAPAGGTDVHPQFDRTAVVAWLLAHDKIEVPVGMPSALLVVVGAGRRTSRFPLDGPHLVLADDDRHGPPAR